MYVGIDLGTTFSLIARVDARGMPVLSPDRHEAKRFKTPSVVHSGEASGRARVTARPESPNPAETETALAPEAGP
jgi:molecular chaperone DnaK (HSP70)